MEYDWMLKGMANDYRIELENALLEIEMLKNENEELKKKLQALTK